MLPAIDFNDELVPIAKEIGEIGADRRLSAKLGVRKVFAEFIPEEFFGFRGVSAKGTGAVGGSCRIVLHTLTLPALRAGSLPLPMGEGKSAEGAKG